jgi:site-specific DNA recombinase
MKAILYARVTTDAQREASLDDQLRECEELCRREGFTIVARESDYGISGESSERPAYQRLLSAVKSGGADVVVAHEQSRLWRSEAELHTQIEEFQFRGRHVVTCDGIDTRKDGFEFLLAVKGAQNKTETKRIATRVHRSLKGNVINGRSAGGRAYGYRSQPIENPTRKDTYGRPLIIGATRVIDPEQAEVVRRIFTMYADGASARTIAATLNAEGIPSPGSHWQRKTRRTDGRWLASTIAGDMKRNSGILNNPLYAGLLVWNIRQMKKRPRTSKRVAMIRPAEERLEREEPTLRIVAAELWQRVKDRQAKQAAELGPRISAGIRKHRPGAGRPARYMLSGLLRCSECGAGFVLSNKTRYQCASHVNGGSAACNVSLSVPRERIERVFLDYMAGPELPQRLADLEKKLIAAGPVTIDLRPRIAELERQRANLVEAVKAGFSAEVGVELKRISAELERAQAMAASAPQLMHKPGKQTIEQRLARIRQRLAEGGEPAQVAIRELFPAGLQLSVDPESRRFLWLNGQTASPTEMLFDAEGFVTADSFPRVYNSLLDERGFEGVIGPFSAQNGQAAGVVGNSMVAGVGFEPTTFGL